MKLVYAEGEEGEEVISPWIPWTQRAGGENGQNDWDPPQVGEQMMMVSPSGDINKGSWAMYGGWTDDNKQIHDKLGDEKYTVGKNTSRLMTGDKIVYKTKEFVVEADQITFNGKRIDHNQLTS